MGCAHINFVFPFKTWNMKYQKKVFKSFKRNYYKTKINKQTTNEYSESISDGILRAIIKRRKSVFQIQVIQSLTMKNLKQYYLSCPCIKEMNKKNKQHIWDNMFIRFIIYKSIQFSRIIRRSNNPPTLSFRVRNFTYDQNKSGSKDYIQQIRIVKRSSTILGVRKNFLAFQIIHLI